MYIGFIDTNFTSANILTVFKLKNKMRKWKYIALNKYSR